MKRFQLLILAFYETSLMVHKMNKITLKEDLFNNRDLSSLKHHLKLLEI